MIVDAHQHYWEIARGDYSWIDESNSELFRDFFPDDLAPQAKACNVQATVAVQAAPTVAETIFLLKLARSEPAIKGVVGWVDLESLDAAEKLRELAADPLFKGIRPMLTDIEDDAWILTPLVIKNLEVAAEMGLTLDALIQPRHFFAIQNVAAAIPGLKIVVDHLAKPAIRDGMDAGDSWRCSMSLLAAHDQVYCKLSGLANEYGKEWSAQSLQPLFDYVLKCFGPDRIMWGSDWPVLNLAGNYQDWFACARTMTQGLSTDDLAKVFGGTAAKFYRLDA